MVIDGTQGSSPGPGLVQLLNDVPKAGTRTSSIVYRVSWGYKYGLIDHSNLSDGQCTTPTCVSDAANILQGWTTREEEWRQFY